MFLTSISICLYCAVEVIQQRYLTHRGYKEGRVKKEPAICGCNIMNEMNAMTDAMNAMTDTVSTITFPPFLFHYIIVVICVVFLVSVCVLKFKYLFWYSQPITFRFTFARWSRGDGGGCKNTSIMNPLSLVQQYRKATVYPFLHFVNHDSVVVYNDGCAGAGAGTPPYQDIAQFLSRRETELVTPGQCEDARIHIRGDIFELMYNLSAFIGVFSGSGSGSSGSGSGSGSGSSGTGIKGVCVLAPRIMLSFSSVKTDPPRSVTIYLCEHLSWAKYITSERESLELLETTEYIQKSREIAGEQTLYKYHEIPWFVIPFTTVYRYTFSGSVASAAAAIGAGVTLIKVSSVNFALFYTFVNECARDFRYCIFHELTQLQSLVQSGVYSIYMLLLHQVRVLAVYIFAPSWMKVSPAHTHTSATSTATAKPKRTRGNRISSLHDHISRTSTALVKYLPPVTRPTYDAFGKRIKYTAVNGDGDGGGSVDLDAPDILLLKSSIRHKTLCDHGVFVRGFIAAAAATTTMTSTHTVVCIDTIAHNYHIIDALVSPSPPFMCISQDKWYYILYNAIIHEETVCKDILMV